MGSSLVHIYVFGLIVTGVLSVYYNRNVWLYLAIGLLLTPVVSIVTLIVLGRQRKDFVVKDNRDKAIHAVPTVGDIDDVDVKVQDTPTKPVFPDVEVEKETYTTKQKSKRSNKSKRGKSKSNQNRKAKQQTEKSTTGVTSTDDNTASIATAAVIGTALYTNDDYSDYSSYTPSTSSSSYDSSSSCSSYDSGSSSSSCD